MATTHNRLVYGQLCKLVGASSLEEISDGQLLERFVASGDEAAFGSLLRRHGSMVLHVCRRVLHHSQDAEDAFQGTFLLLAKKAGSIRKQESVASWLYGVAYRLAVRSKARNTRREAKEKQVVGTRQIDAGLQAAWGELQSILTEELHCLPDRYQAPLVLCYLEGKTHEEAAKQLALPLGTVRSRVARARELLKGRLARRGLALPAAVLATALAADVARAVPPGLLNNTCQAALAHAAGKTIPAGLVTAEAVALAKGGLTAMTATHLKLGVVLLLAVSIAAAGVGTVASGLTTTAATATAAPAEPLSAADAPPAQPKGEPGDAKGAPLPADATARLGAPQFWPGGAFYSDNTLTFTPDSKHVALVGADRTVHIWDVHTGNEIARVGKPDAVGAIPRQAVLGMAFSPDGNLVAVVENDTVINVWDIKENKEAARLTVENKATLHACVFAPDGKTVAAPGRDGSVYRWEVAGWKKLPALEGHKGAVNAVAFSHDSAALASVGDDETVRVWDAATGKNVKTLTGHRDRVLTVAFAPSGKSLASRSGDNTIRLWDLDSGKTTRSIERPVLPYVVNPLGNSAISFLPDGKYLAAADSRGTRTYDIASGEEMRYFSNGSYDGAASVVSPDGKLLATGGYGQRIRVWDAATGKELTKAAGHQGPVTAIVFSPDRKTLATGSRDRTVRLWDVASGAERHKLTGHSGAVSLLRFSPDGKHLATASGEQNDRTVSWWNVKTGVEEYQFHGHTGGIEALGVSADGKQVSVMTKEGTLTVWDTASGEQVRQVKGMRLFNAAFAPDGRTLAFQLGTQAELKIWDTTKEGAVRSLEGQAVNNFPRMAFSPDGRLLLTAGFTNTIDILDVASGKSVRHLTRPPETLPLNTGTGNALPVFTADARSIAVPARGGAIALVESATGKDRHVFRGQQGAITALALSDDGTLLASGSDDGTALIWDMKSAGQPAKAEMSAADLDAAWVALGRADPAEAYRAVRSLAESREAIPFLRKQLSAVAPSDPKRIEQLIADLGNDDFAVRKKAEDELSKLGGQTRTAMLKALETKPSLDVMQRLEMLLRTLDEHPLTAEDIRTIRVVETLETMRTDGARELLRDWSKGAPESVPTEEAKAALERLGKTCRRTS
jgi:RNA polymerase sigma factor (sigma-70 family)